MRIPNYIVGLPHPYNKIGDGPEGAEVARVADALSILLTNRTITSVSIAEKGLKNHNSLTTLTLPSKILRVTSKGKKIILHLEDEVVIANALLMSGYWSLKPDNYVKFTLTFVEGDPLYFSSIRSFSRTHVLRNTKEKEEYFSKVGPDLLRDVVTPGEWLERMREMTIKRHLSRPFLICDALIEQKIFSGAGNYLRADAMYEAKIRPNRAVSDLTDEELERVRVAVCGVIRRSYKSEGYTIRDFKHVDGRSGLYKPLIYGQEVDGMGNTVVRERFPESKHKNRTVHWVPEIQL